MKATKIIPAVLAVMMFASCEKVIDFDPGEIEPYVVMVSRPEADSLVNVYLSYSRFFLDNNNAGNEISNAAVTLEVNGVSVPAAYVDDYSGNGHYLVNVQPQAGDSLRLTAAVPGYEKIVFAETRVPDRPQIELLDYIIDTTESYYSEWDSTWHHDNTYFKFRLKVKSKSPNEYYALTIKMAEIKYNYGWDTNEASMDNVYFEVSDPLVNSQNIEDLIDGYDGHFWGSQMTFSSEGFENGAHEFVVEFDRYLGNWSGGNIADIPVIVSVRSISKDLYLYNRTTDQQSDLDELFGEPVQVHCNIKGGIGIFGASCTEKKRLSNPRFEQFSHNNGYYYK